MSKNKIALNLAGMKEIQGMSTADVETFYHMAVENKRKKDIFRHKKTNKMFLGIVEAANVELYSYLSGDTEILTNNLGWSVRKAIGIHSKRDGNTHDYYLFNRTISFSEMVKDFEIVEEEHAFAIENVKFGGMFNSMITLEEGHSTTFVTAKKVTARNEFTNIHGLYMHPSVIEDVAVEMMPKLDLAFKMAQGKVQQSVEFRHQGFAFELTVAMNEKQQMLLSSRRGTNVRWTHECGGAGTDAKKHFLCYRLVMLDR